MSLIYKTQIIPILHIYYTFIRKKIYNGITQQIVILFSLSNNNNL